MKTFLATLLLCASAAAAAWQPTRPVTVLIGFGPGSGNEVSFRAVAQQVEQTTGAKFIVVNQPGADGVISLNHLASSVPDGYTINIASQHNFMVMSDILYAKEMKFTPDSFTYTVGISRAPLVIIAPADSSVNTPRDLVRLLETTTRPITFAVGSGSHRLAYQYLLDNTKSRKDMITVVNYRGPAQAGADVAARAVDFGILSAAIAQNLVTAGRVKIIGICNDRTLPRMPGVPTMDSVVPGLAMYSGFSILLPRDTPAEIQKWYVDHFARAIRSEQSRRFFEDNLMFTDERDLAPEGHRRNLMELRRQWLPIAQRMDFKQ